MIPLKNTLHRGYIVLNKRTETLTAEKIAIISKMASFLERRNIFLKDEVFEVLSTQDKKNIRKYLY